MLLTTRGGGTASRAACDQGGGEAVGGKGEVFQGNLTLPASAAPGLE